MSSKALVVDDSRAVRGILARILNGLGFDVEQAGNGREALACMESQGGRFDVVLSDWNMPEMDGLEFLRALRADGRFADVPVMMVTTETHLDQMTVALEAGANEYIMKPFTAAMVEEKLRMLQIAQAHE